MFVTVFFELYKLYLVTCAGFAVTIKATVSICSGIDLQRRRFVRVEGAKQPVVFIRL